MKIYAYLALFAAVIGFVFWLRADAVKDLQSDLAAAEAEHRVEIERLKRVHDDVKRRLEGETRRRLDQLKSVTVDGCFGVDDHLPPGLVRLLNPSPDKTRP